MNAVESLMLNFLKKELTNNPDLAGKLLAHLLEQWKVDPTIEHDIVQLFDQLLPMLLQKV
jgi:hypothetical protein